MKVDSHPAQKSKSISDFFCDSEMTCQLAPGQIHEGASKPEVSFMHDVPASMALLRGAPDLNEGHFFSAFLTVQVATNDLVSEKHTPPTSAKMRYLGLIEPLPNLLDVYGSAAKALDHPEVRDSKYELHASPCIYTGPPHESYATKHCSV